MLTTHKMTKGERRAAGYADAATRTTGILAGPLACDLDYLRGLKAELESTLRNVQSQIDNVEMVASCAYGCQAFADADSRCSNCNGAEVV